MKSWNLFWWVIFALTTAGVFLLGWLVAKLKWVEAAGLAGSYASVFGIVYTFVQVLKVKSTASQIEEAVKTSNGIILNINSIEDLSKSYQIACVIPNYINQGQLECAMLRMTDLLKSLGDIRNHESLKDNFPLKCDRFCSILISDIQSLNANITSKSRIDLQLIVEHIVELTHFLNTTNNQLKTSAYVVA